MLFTFAAKVEAKRHYSVPHFKSNRFVYNDDQQSLYVYEVYILVYVKVDDDETILHSCAVLFTQRFGLGEDRI